MTGIIFAIITVLAWRAWLAPSQKIQFANPQIKTMYLVSSKNYYRFNLAWLLDNPAFKKYVEFIR